MPTVEIVRAWLLEPENDWDRLEQIERAILSFVPSSVMISTGDFGRLLPIPVSDHRATGQVQPHEIREFKVEGQVSELRDFHAQNSHIPSAGVAVLQVFYPEPYPQEFSRIASRLKENWPEGAYLIEWGKAKDAMDTLRPLEIMEFIVKRPG
jgi:hypothetical protein